MSNLATFFPQRDPVPRMAEPVLRVEVAGHWRPRLRLVGYEQSAGGAPTVSLARDTGRLTESGISWFPESTMRAIDPGDLVTVDLVRSGMMRLRGSHTVRLFEGAIDGPAFAYGPDGDQAGFRAVDRSDALLTCRAGGQQVSGAGGESVWLSGIDLVFNPDGRANMADTSSAPGGGRWRRLFTSPGGVAAEAWTTDQAANYLVSTYAEVAWLNLPTMSDLSRLFGSEVLENVRLEGATVLGALEQLGRRVGIRPTVALSLAANGSLVRTLVFVGRGLGRTISLYHQLPGETFTLTRTAMQRAEVEVAWADAPASLELSGDVKLYETTFSLVPGWDRDLEGDERDAYRRSNNPNFADRADVFRKWVLNEAGDYTGEPFSAGPAYDFEPLFGTGDTLARRRRFLPTISTDDSGQSHGVFVEISTDGGSTWARYRGAVAVLRDECGITLSSDTLPPEVFHAAARDDLAVRVTATVESDMRLAVTVERPGLAADHRGPRLWHDVSDAYHVRVVDTGSIFYGGPGRAVDDGDRLVALAADLWQARRHAPVPSRITLPFLSVSYRVGDRIDGVRYRAARLRRTAGGIDTDPMVTAVKARWTADGGWQTFLELR